MLSIRVGADWNNGTPTGGRWLHGLIPYGSLALQTAFQRPTDSTGGGGLLTVSWDMAMPGNLPLPTQVRWDSLVELYAGSWPLGMAVVSETPNGNTVTADGLFRLGENFLAVNASNKATTDLSVAIPQAISRGLRWVNPGDLPVGSLSTLSETSAQMNTISALLNAYCKQNNKYWRVDRFGVLRITDPPDVTVPTWALSPLLPTPQTADDDFVSRWFVRRVNSVNADGQPITFDSETVNDPDAPAIREDFADLEQLGTLSAAGGVAAAQAYLNANKSRAAFTEGVRYAAGQLTTLGGTAPEPWAVMAGDVVQQPNWMTAAGDLVLGNAQSWVIGGTQWQQGQSPVVTPLGLAPRTVASVQQTAGGRTKRLVFS